MPRNRSVYTTARPRSGAAPRPGRPRTIAIASAKTSTSASARNIIFRFTVNPDQTSGRDSRALDGLKKAWRTLWSACTFRLRYFRFGSFEKSRLNHFFCSLEIVPFAHSFLIPVLSTGVSLLPFWSTAPYCSCVTIWAPTGP